MPSDWRRQPYPGMMRLASFGIQQTIITHDAQTRGRICALGLLAAWESLSLSKTMTVVDGTMF